MKFSKEFMLEEVLDAPFIGDSEVELISDDIVDTSRWSEIHEIVFSYGSKFYSTTYSCGATEQQEEGPWEYDGNMIEVTEVEPVEVVVTQYKPVKEEK